MTHSFLVKIEFVGFELSTGASGLLTEEGASGASACGEAIDVWDVVVDIVMGALRHE